MKKKSRTLAISQTTSGEYGALIGEIAGLLEAARRTAARTVNALMTATYWEIGRRIVEFEQQGKARAEYGEELLQRLSADLRARFGRGFSRFNLGRFRAFYLAFPDREIRAMLSLESSGEKRATVSLKSRETGIAQTPPGQLQLPKKIQTASGKSPAPPILSTVSIESSRRKSQTLSGELTIRDLADRFPLPWSAYVRLLTIKNELARAFYHAEALRGGWSVRQLDRQIASQFYERTALSTKKASMLRKGAAARPEDAVSADEEVRDPVVLEFLGLKDEYSESDLEDALLHHLENFLLGIRRRFRFYRTATPSADRKRMVSNRSPLFPSQTTLPRGHRLEGRQIHPCRRRTDASLPQLRARTLDSARRKSTGWFDPLR